MYYACCLFDNRIVTHTMMLRVTFLSNVASRQRAILDYGTTFTQCQLNCERLFISITRKRMPIWNCSRKNSTHFKGISSDWSQSPFCAGIPVFSERSIWEACEMKQIPNVIISYSSLERFLRLICIIGSDSVGKPRNTNKSAGNPPGLSPVFGFATDLATVTAYSEKCVVLN